VDPCDDHRDVGDVGDGDSVIVNDGMSDESVNEDAELNDVGCLDHVQVVQHVDSQSQADMAAKSMAPVKSIDMVGCQRPEAANTVQSLAALSHKFMMRSSRIKITSSSTISILHLLMLEQFICHRTITGRITVSTRWT
jgi:hypothetical protein